MNRARPYLNKYTKRKEQQIEDAYHSTNLRQIKPITTKLMDHSDAVIINNRKRDMLKEEREVEIQRENKVLLQKISSVMSKKGAYSVSKTKNIRTKVNKSLNQFYKKRQMEQIQIENKRFVARLQQKKPTLNLQKLNKEWLDNKDVIKRMSNQDFNLTSIKSTSRVRSITLDRLHKSKYDKAKFTKVKVLSGVRMLIKVEMGDQVLKIIGDTQDSKDLKIIQIPKDEAITFIQRECQGKVENILNKLKYDVKQETLYLVSDNLQQDDLDFAEFNPQVEQIADKKKETNKKMNVNIQNKYTLDVEKEKNVNVEPAVHNQVEKLPEKQKETVDNTYHQTPVQEAKPIQKAEEPPAVQDIVQENKAVVQKEMPKVEEEKEPSVQEKKQTEQRVAQTKEIIEPQVDNYEEENFEETPSNLKESKPQEEVNPAPQVIVAPEQEENYNEQFEASGAVENKAKQEAKEGITNEAQ